MEKFDHFLLERKKIYGAIARLVDTEAEIKMPLFFFLSNSVRESCFSFE